jgi:Putative auto-transporter adhesin, head GIN domain
MKKALIPIIILTFYNFMLLDAQQARHIPPIKKVIVSNGVILQLEHGDSYQLQIKVQDMDSACLINTIKDGTLTLKIDNGFNCRGKAAVNFLYTDLKIIEAMGKAEVSTKNLIKSDSLILIFKSGAQGYIDMDIKYLNADIVEGGMLKAEGYAVKQDISVTTGSTFSGYELEGEIVNVKTSISGKAKICASEELNAIAGSSGYISFKCNPKKKVIDDRGSGTIEEYK